MPSVSIDCFHEHLSPIAPGTAIVAIDVIRATTTAITGATAGRLVYPAGSIEAAVRLAADLDNPLLAGELGGVQPYGFDLQNSPTQILALPQTPRPIVLLSTSGTRLIAEAVRHGKTYACCLRNVAATADALVGLGRDVAILGADSRGEFRAEDQLCAARIGQRLLDAGFDAVGEATAPVLERYGAAPGEVILDGPSARYLRDTGQEADLEFVLAHIDDLREVFVLDGGLVRRLPES